MSTSLIVEGKLANLVIKDKTYRVEVDGATSPVDALKTEISKDTHHQLNCIGKHSETYYFEEDPLKASTDVPHIKELMGEDRKQMMKQIANLNARVQQLEFDKLFMAWRIILQDMNFLWEVERYFGRMGDKEKKELLEGYRGDRNSEFHLMLVDNDVPRPIDLTNYWPLKASDDTRESLGFKLSFIRKALSSRTYKEFLKSGMDITLVDIYAQYVTEAYPKDIFLPYWQNCPDEMKMKIASNLLKSFSYNIGVKKILESMIGFPVVVEEISVKYPNGDAWSDNDEGDA
jgi:hypothetical protein